MQPVDIQQIGEDLAIRWEDATEHFIPLATLRRYCPCAGCQGETDILGNVYGGNNRPLSAEAFRVIRIARVGAYAIQPIWADGHTTGIYSFDYLRQLGGLPEK